MEVKGCVDIQLRLNVYGLETDAIEVEDGAITIVDDVNFFMDWCEHWGMEIGELIGVPVNSFKLEEEE